MELIVFMLMAALMLKIAGMAVIFLIACVLGALSSRN
jgi:hypothetical protein